MENGRNGERDGEKERMSQREKCFFYVLQINRLQDYKRFALFMHRCTHYTGHCPYNIYSFIWVHLILRYYYTTYLTIRYRYIIIL